MKTIRKNNFDTCSYMPAVEISLFRDEDFARTDFEENFERLSSDTWLFVDSGNVCLDKIFVTDILDFSEVSQQEAKDFLIENYSYSVDDEQLTGFDFVQECSDYLNGDDRIKDILRGDENYAIPASAKLKFQKIIVRGYCQGDYAQVIALQDTYESFWPELGESEKHMRLRDHFCDMFYNQPLYCSVKVDGEEYLLHEGLTESYVYDKEELLKLLNDSDLSKRFDAEKFNQIMEYVKKELPNTL